jgi:hypothetical protein
MTTPTQAASEYGYLDFGADYPTDSIGAAASEGAGPSSDSLRTGADVMVSHLNVLLRENQQLRDALRRLHDWVLAQEGDCMFSGDHPIAQAAAVLQARTALASVEVPK